MITSENTTAGQSDEDQERDEEEQQRSDSGVSDQISYSFPMSEEEERKLIRKEYLKLLRSIKSEMDNVDRRNIRMAYDLAVQAHSTQRRKSGEPYILHPIAVARICAEEIGLGPTAVVAALLHDVVEDTDVTLDDIKVKFGPHIAKMVNGLTKLDSAYNAESPQAENFKKVLSTLVEDVRIVLIKMADRLHNMRTLGSMPLHKQLKIAAETSYIYAPLAHRLGLYNFKTEFLDLCMKITDREQYTEIARKLQDTKRSRDKYIKEFLAPIDEKLDLLQVGNQHLTYDSFGRSKSIYSVWNKLKTKHVPFEEIYDLFAVRIVLDVPPEQEKSMCWQVYSIVTDVYRPIPERLKDWISIPKSNGYESLHTTVIGPKGRFVEVQIRTERMDEIAERGFAAHWKYKGVGNQSDVYERWLDSVRETLDTNNSDAVEFLFDFKSNNLFNDEVYVFTPKGDMRILPKGATALDFAFSIHTDVGYHCKAVKVNNLLVPLGHELHNGDQVQVMTDKRQKPSEDWLKICITGKARGKIRSLLKEERRQQTELGKEELERKFKKQKVDYFDEAVDLITRHFGFNSRLDLYHAIMIEKFSPAEIFTQFRVENGHLITIEAPKPQENSEEKGLKTSPGKKLLGKPRLLINGEPAERYDYVFATCCNPVQGDEVFAYLTSNAGLKIHRVNCPNAANLMANYGYRILRADWVATTGTNFVADLLITGVDDGPGVIERLSRHISSELGLNIRQFSIAGDQGYFEGKVSLFVANTDQLNQAIKALKNLKNISSVIRVEN